MALDSRDRRASAQGFLLAPLPLADSTVGEADRPHVAWVYRGLTYTVAAAVKGASTSLVAARYGSAGAASSVAAKADSTSAATDG